MATVHAVVVHDRPEVVDDIAGARGGRRRRGRRPSRGRTQRRAECHERATGTAAAMTIGSHIPRRDVVVLVEWLCWVGAMTHTSGEEGKGRATPFSSRHGKEVSRRTTPDANDRLRHVEKETEPLM